MCLAVSGCPSSCARSGGSASVGRDGVTSSGNQASSAIWRPAPGTSWQWQLQGTIDDSFDVKMYDVDLFDVPDAVFERLRGRGVKIVCYFSAGSHENWRSDAKQFPSEAIGRPLSDWPNERWLDIRSRSVRARMIARLDRAAARGCDGVEPDNVDGYANESGFPLTAADQLDFNRFLAREAHARGLSIGLKNDLDQIAELEPHFDWALVEECMKYNECDRMTPFIAAGKAVFHVEYGDAGIQEAVCSDANARNFDTLIKRLLVDSFRIACR
jgi:hypothetical protein